MGNKFKKMNDYRKIYVMVMLLYIVAQVVGGMLFKMWDEYEVGGAWYGGISAAVSLLIIYLYDQGIDHAPTVIDRALEVGILIAGASDALGAFASYKYKEEFTLAAMLAGAFISVIVLAMTFYLDESDQC